MNIYDNTDPRQPKFLQAIAAAPGAHHTVLSPDERYLFVQNSLLNLDGMSDGSITVIDLAKEGQVLGSIDTLKAQGFNPNCIMLLPNHFQKREAGQAYPSDLLDVSVERRVHERDWAAAPMAES